MTNDPGEPAPRIEARSAPVPHLRGSWLLRTGLSLTVWTLAGVATVLVAVAFLLIGYRRARRGDSASTLWLLAAAVGAFAVYTNVVHCGGRAGLVFGVELDEPAPPRERVYAFLDANIGPITRAGSAMETTRTSSG